MFPMLPFPSLREVIAFALVLTRVAGIFAALPVFGGQRIPLQIRVVVVLMITLVTFPSLSVTPPAIPTDAFALVGLLLCEMAVGLTLAFVAQILFSAIEFGGQIIGMQMGFTMARILDPSLGGQAEVISVLQTLFATLLFLTMNIHHMFIRAIIDSFSVIPIGGWHLNNEVITFLVVRTKDIFVLGVRLAAPVMVSLLLTSVALGVMARSFPQMNIFMVSMPLNIGIGFVVLGATLLIFFHVLEVSFDQLKGQIDTIFRLVGKGG
jgi:flagellar biosynthesis protein FliR